MLNQLLQFLVKCWKDEDKLEKGDCFDLIIPISYGTESERLIIATETIVRQAAQLRYRYPKAELVVSNCSYTFPNAAKVEWRHKQKLLADCGVIACRAGDMNNSVDEAQAIRRYVAEHELPAKHILIVTGEMHSRSARWIWRRVMPNSQITVTCVKNEFEWQSDHPVLVQRTAWKWLLANIARQVLLQVLGLRLIGNMHHRSKIS